MNPIWIVATIIFTMVWLAIALAIIPIRTNEGI